MRGGEPNPGLPLNLPPVQVQQGRSRASKDQVGGAVKQAARKVQKAAGDMEDKARDRDADHCG